jgi:hypothetical protein
MGLGKHDQPPHRRARVWKLRIGTPAERLETAHDAGMFGLEDVEPREVFPDGVKVGVLSGEDGREDAHGLENNLKCFSQLTDPDKLSIGVQVVVINNNYLTTFTSFRKQLSASNSDVR